VIPEETEEEELREKATSSLPVSHSSLDNSTKQTVTTDATGGEVDDEDFLPEGVEGGEVTADTIIQLKRLRTFARGGFKSQFSIENNCAFSEHEALKLGLIVSQQEADYGINMYDALLPSDEKQIEQLIRTGCTLDEAILKVFESRFGKTKLDSSALQVRSYLLLLISLIDCLSSLSRRHFLAFVYRRFSLVLSFSLIEWKSERSR
jgi:hypothetical protein